ncbi:macro domain-containing protein [Occallatibacter savannae]|uniref:macro domain-containing protein n=1 Tax=Occallatibacter savannae TaxID=1002691 RepID=UPI000D69B6E5|nr:macro domain-containing protein [Occallatibacter savannae]
MDEQRVELVFVDESPDVVNSWASAFGRRRPEHLKFMLGNLFHSGPGVIVTPSNSEGELSAGVDFQLKMLFPELEAKLEQHIRIEPAGRLHIERPVWIETGNIEHPAVIFSALLNSPSDPATPNRVYKASLAVFRLVQQHGFPGLTRRVLIPGFGTGVAGLDADVAARKMCQAYFRSVER